jgi:hypothetical protein
MAATAGAAVTFIGETSPVSMQLKTSSLKPTEELKNEKFRCRFKRFLMETIRAVIYSSSNIETLFVLNELRREDKTNKTLFCLTDTSEK